MWLPASTTPSTRYLVPKAPKHTFPSSDGSNETTIAGFTMPESETEQKADLNPFPREEIAALKSWCTAPHGSGCAQGVRRYAPQAPFPLKAAHPTSTGNFAPAAVCAQASAMPLPSPASPSKTSSHAQSARQKKKARCALPATTTCSKGSPHAVTLSPFPA